MNEQDSPVERSVVNSVQTTVGNSSEDPGPLQCETTSTLDRNDEVVHTAGIGVFLTAMFVSGEMAGIGILALPQAVGQAGWIGIPLIILCGIVSGYNGMNLGKCWTMMLERYPEMRTGRERRPYPAMGQKAYGKWMKVAILVSIEVNLFGSSAVFMLLASENVQSILQQHAGVNISFCYWLLLVTAVLLPLSWLGTPKDFWPAAVGATTATSTAVILIFADTMTDLSQKDSAVRDSPTFISFSLAFGTMLYSFGGVGTFPTIQNDMKKPQQFSKSVVIAYLIVGCMYMPVAVSGFVVYGTDVNPNVLQSIPDGALRVTAEVLITCHVMFAFVIVLNPFSQDMEELFNVPHRFHWSRCLLRSCIVLAGLFIAESIPSFNLILNLLGASANAIASFIAPPLLYLRMCSMEGNWSKVQIAVGATFATVIAVTLTTISTALDISRQTDVPHANPTFYSFMLAFGTILFSFGGSGTFPTIQQDMKKPQKFPLTVLVSYSGVLLMYLPVTITAYFAYGTDVQGNVLQSLPNGPLRVTAEVVITLHVLFAFIINLNPFLQDMEELFSVPHKFGWRKCLLRTFVLLACLFVAEAVPRFDAVLNLLGASATAFLTFVAPSLLYLSFMESKNGKGTVPLHVKVFNWEIIIIGVLGGVIATVCACIDIASVNFVPPCFVNITAASLANQVS